MCDIHFLVIIMILFQIRFFSLVSILFSIFQSGLNVMLLKSSLTCVLAPVGRFKAFIAFSFSPLISIRQCTQLIKYNNISCCMHLDTLVEVLLRGLQIWQNACLHWWSRSQVLGYVFTIIVEVANLYFIFYTHKTPASYIINVIMWLNTCI